MKSKFFFITLFFAAASPFVAAQQPSTVRFGGYLDFFRFGLPGIEPGGLVEILPSNWYMLKAGVGVFFEENTYWIDCGKNCTTTMIRFRPAVATMTITPSIRLGKTLSVDPNLRVFAGKVVKMEFAPGFSLRHGKFQIRANYHLSSGLLGIGLAFFPKNAKTISKS